jgi:hypothetical protein
VVTVGHLRWQGNPFSLEKALEAFQESDWKTLVELYREGR